MERPVEVALFERGELQSVRTLSLRLERRAAAFAALATGIMVLAAMGFAAAMIASLQLVVHAATFFLCWMGVAVGVAIVAARRARDRARRFALGVTVDADAFGASEVDLVRRVGRRDDYELGLVPGMAGAIEHGRSPLAIEALTRAGVVRVPLPSEGKVRIDYGVSTFVVRRRAERPEAAAPALGERLQAAVATAQRLLPMAGAAVPVAALVTLLGVAPSAMAVNEADMRSPIPSNATAWETELSIRAQAQRQVRTLHRCFDPLPLACQKAGFVGVGLQLARSGEVRTSWVSRSTYKHDCPVSQCMAEVIGGWFFEPMPEGMNVVVPVQVRRTSRPLYDPRPIVVTPVSAGDAGLGGALEVAAE